MTKLSKIDQKLIEIASKSGSPTALDTPEEKQEAEKFLGEQVKSLENDFDSKGNLEKAAEYIDPNGTDLCTREMAESALEALKKSDDSRALSVSHIFGDEPDIGCNFLCIGSPETELLTPLEDDQVMSVRVYTGGEYYGRTSQEVMINKSEWEFIVAPLKELHAKAEKPNKADVEKGVESANRANEMMEALENSVQRYEKTIMKKSSISKDRGGPDNDNLADMRELSEGQQDSISEALTTRQAISVFNVSGLLGQWKFDPSDSMIEATIFMHGDYPFDYIFPRVQDEYGSDYAVDSWSSDAGGETRVAPPEVIEDDIVDIFNRYDSVWREIHKK